MRFPALVLTASSLLLLQATLVSPTRAQCLPAACGGAGTPCAVTSSVPDLLVGSGRTTGDQSALVYEVVVRAVNGAAVPGAVVTLDFSAATAATTGNNSQEVGTTLNCALATLTRTANAFGQVRFRPQFFGGANAAVVAVFADGVCLGNTRPRSTDAFQTAGAKTDLTDLGGSVLLGCPTCPYWGFTEAYLKGPGSYSFMYDYDDNGFVGLADLSIIGRDYIMQQAGTYCGAGW